MVPPRLARLLEACGAGLMELVVSELKRLVLADLENGEEGLLWHFNAA